MIERYCYQEDQHYSILSPLRAIFTYSHLDPFRFSPTIRDWTLLDLKLSLRAFMARSYVSCKDTPPKLPWNNKPNSTSSYSTLHLRRIIHEEPDRIAPFNVHCTNPTQSSQQQYSTNVQKITSLRLEPQILEDGMCYHHEAKWTFGQVYIFICCLLCSFLKLMDYHDLKLEKLAHFFTSLSKSKNL